MKGEREIPAAAARSLWCPGMLMDIEYLVSSEDHFGREREREKEREREREREYLVKLHGLSAGVDKSL